MQEGRKEGGREVGNLTIWDEKNTFSLQKKNILFFYFILSHLYVESQEKEHFKSTCQVSK